MGNNAIEKNIYLVDGSALVYRSFHAFSGRVQIFSNGQDVGMVYGFLLSILGLIKKEQPDRFAIVFDTGAPTFRHRMFDQYKANRPPMDEGLRAQLPLLTEIINLLKIPQMSLEGWEADDIMGTLAVRAAEDDYDVFLVTGDKDFYQLVNEKIKVYTLPTKRNPDRIIYDADGVKEKFGVYPEKVIDALAMIGDTSDNVPGIPGVGPKTAVKLLDEFGDLETALDSASKVKQKKLSQNLTEFADQARFARKLVTIELNTPVNTVFDELKIGSLNNPGIRAKLADLEFKSILDLLNDLEPVEKSEIDSELYSVEYETITTPSELDNLIDILKDSELISLDTETTSLNPMRAELVGFSFSIREKQGWYVSVNFFKDVPVEFSPSEAPYLRPDITRELSFIFTKLKPILESKSIPKTGQNLKYDAQVIACYEVELNGIVFDTMIASHILDSASRQNNLDFLAEKHLEIIKVPTKNLIGSGAKQISMLDVPLNVISKYASEDADIALRLTNLFRFRIEKNDFSQIYYQQEIPLIEVLRKMEHNGVSLDLDLLSEMSTEFQYEMNELEIAIYKSSGSKFNLNSTQQLADVLFDKLRLPAGRKTKSGYSTDIRELTRLAPVHEVPEKLLRFRHLAKLKSTYIDALPKLIHPITGRIHTNYSQTIAITGRLSSNNPNLQNIPIRSEEGSKIRQAFVPIDKGWKIVAADYSQIELRIMAHFSGDETMINAFEGGLDIHRTTASWMHDIPQGLITSDMRRQAKEVNFGVLYGMESFGLSQRLGISRKRASEFIEQYFSKFPKVKDFINKTIESVKEQGFVETISGRRRSMPEINARAFQVRKNAERMAVNTPIQGSAADLMKIAMLRVHEMIAKEEFRTRMLMQVHDELVFESPEDEIKIFSKKLNEVMVNAIKLKLPLEVEISSGDNWLDARN